MTVDEVIKLVNAGFTAEDIKGMSNNTKVDEPDVQEEIKEKEVNKPIVEESKTVKYITDEDLKDIKSEIKSLKKQLKELKNTPDEEKEEE